MKKISAKSNDVKKAFSLIELSIVILIIGILIAGVIQGGKMLNEFRLQTARSLTKSSPVAGITGLVAWYDSTSAESFDSTVNEDSAIASWYDINPQSSTKNNGTQSTADYKPLYKIESKTGLPMVYFDGSNDYISLPDGTIPPDDSSFTIFIATSPLYNTTFDKTFIMCEGALNANNMILRVRSNTDFSVPMFSTNGSHNLSGSNTVTMSKMNILTASYSNGYSNTASSSQAIKLYSNGSLKGSRSITTPRTTPTVNNVIGMRKANAGISGDALYGYIGEIIIFSRSLSAEDRSAVEKYLGQKWGVVINN